MQERDSEIHFQLMGALKYDQLFALRRAFLEASGKRKDIVLDFKDASYIDSAFIGLVLILYKHQLAGGLQLELNNLSKELKKILDYNNAAYLLD
jgi:anti-anti-sigma factor